MSRPPTAVTLDAETLMNSDLGGVKLIEASAGTGKTHTIADLYLRHILAGRQPSQILVVTYTNAATEELRGRIRKRLYDALNLFEETGSCEDEFFELLLAQWHKQDDESRTLQLRYLQLALRSMDEASISTIHSFCQRSLQDHALSGNQFFDSEMLSSDDQLWEDAIKDWWRSHTYDLDEEDWSLIHGSLPSISGITEILLELRNKPLARLLPEQLLSLENLAEKPRQIAQALLQLAPLWQQNKAEIVETVSNSKVLSRAKKLPYHPDKLDAFIAAADNFFSAQSIRAPFDNFEYLASQWLHKNSKPSKKGQDPRLDHEFFIALNPTANQWIEFFSSIRPMLIINAFKAVSQQVTTTKRGIPALAFQDQLSLLLEALESGSGDKLAERLAQQYPVAMIDEFQDTDTTQYRIFKHIYLHSENSSLTLIGDPKQSIYSFRGGDIFTYMQAKHLKGIQQYGLQTNWRSQAKLVAAVNTLFTQRQNAFLYQDSIQFSQATSTRENDGYELVLDELPATAMSIWQLPLAEQNANYNREQMRDLIIQAIVQEISVLLDNATRQAALINGRPVQSGDIAILVRQASEGHALSQALHSHGIRTVTIGRDSIFKSDEARGLYDLLLAIAQYRDPNLARLSLSTSLLDLDYRQIAEVTDDDNRWQRWVEDLADLQQLWERHGFITMFQALLHKFDIAAHLAQRDNCERRLTNLLHLSELLHQESTGAAGMSLLLSWFYQQFDEESCEEAELRLENDEALVKIVTIHKSKGLQYPIVFVPFLWTCKPVDRNKAIYFHDTSWSSCVDLGSPDFDRNWYFAEKERLAEDMRLLYVALTRARAKVYLAWGPAGSPDSPGYANQTALAYLLHSHQDSTDLEHNAPDGFPSGMNLTRDLQTLAKNSAATIELIDLPCDDMAQRFTADDSRQSPPQLAKFTRTAMKQWRINSFTGLTRGIHQPAQMGIIDSQGDAILDFPAGSHIGLMLHALLENLDFQQDIGQQCQLLFPRLLPRTGISSESDQQTLITWLTEITQTPFGDNGLSLNALSNSQRLNEIAFDFAIDHLDIEVLNQFMQSLSPARIQAVSSPEFSGLITGVIDLVFEHQGRYYLADYKTNFLGASLEDYRPERLEQAMLDRRYDLQSLLYSIALQRYLAQRLADYDYEQHFGGCYYLFLRALRPQHGCRFGVHFNRPPANTLETLETLLEYTPTEEVCA